MAGAEALNRSLAGSLARCPLAISRNFPFRILPAELWGKAFKKLISCGVLTLVISLWQYWWTVRYLWGGSFAQIAGMTKEGMQSPVLAIAILLICIGLFAFFAVLLRLT